MTDIILALSAYIDNTTAEGLDVPFFIENNLPHLLANHSFSDFIYSDTPEAKKADALLSAFKAKKEAEYNRSHKKGTVPNYYKLYCSFASPLHLLSEQEYYVYFSEFCGMPLSGSEYGLNTRVAKAIHSLIAIGESANNILLFLSKLWDDSASLFVPESGNTNEDSETAFAHVRRGKYADAKRQIMPIKNNIIDAICATVTDMEYNDVPLENAAVLQLFAPSVKNSIAVKEPIIIIEPSPYFIKKLKGYNPFRHRQIIYVIKNNLLATIYAKVLNDSFFSIVKMNDFADSLTSVYSYPTNVLIFGTHLKDIELKTDCIEFCLSHISSIHSLYILDTDYYIQHKASPIKLALTKTTINNIWLFPAGITHATKPDMKMLLQCTYGYVQQDIDNIVLTQYSLISNSKEQYLRPYYYQSEISSEDFFLNDIKLRSVYRSKLFEAQAKSAMTRNSAERFVYSTEISVHYTVSGDGTDLHPYRVSAYVRAPYTMGTKPSIIAETKKSTKRISPSEIETWIEDSYLTSRPVRAAIANIYQDYYRGKSITLKTFVLFNYEWENTQPAKALSDLDFLCHSILGDMSISHISYEDVSAALEADDQNVRVRMILLSNLFDLAIKQGYSDKNPVKSELCAVQNEHEELYQIRSNLTLKNLTESNFVHAYQYLIKRCQKGDKPSLASMICLLIGLDTNIVCALKWKDISTIHLLDDEVVFTQFCIQRQLCNDGSELKPFSRKEQYRKLPCPVILSDLIFQEYERAKLLHSGMPQGYIDDSFIFADAATLNKVLSPVKLRKENRKLIKKLNIPAEIIPIPDNSKGTIDTNLAYYPGDIFRTNFDYYARHTGKFELGEIEYFLGLQPSTTFSRNYCDYANDYAQFILFTKLERITKKLFNKDNFHARKEYKSFDDEYSIASTADPHDLSFVGIRLAVSDCSKLSIKVSSKHGYNIRIQEMEVSDDN